MLLGEAMFGKKRTNMQEECKRKGLACFHCYKLKIILLIIIIVIIKTPIDMILPLPLCLDSTIFIHSIINMWSVDGTGQMYHSGNVILCISHVSKPYWLWATKPCQCLLVSILSTLERVIYVCFCPGKMLPHSTRDGITIPNHAWEEAH